MDIDRGEISVVRPRTGDYVERHEMYTASEWTRWPVYWSGIWIGALAALASALVFGLIGTAVGAHQIGPARAIVRLTDLGMGALIFGVVGAFFSFVVGGWVAGRIAGLHRAEPAMLHGSIMWLVTIPMFLLLAAFGAGNLFGGWYGGLAGIPVWVTPSTTFVDPTAAAAARNAALGALTALLIGLVGSVIGGWMASGEPMTLVRHREDDVHYRRAA